MFWWILIDGYKRIQTNAKKWRIAWEAFTFNKLGTNNRGEERRKFMQPKINKTVDKQHKSLQGTVKTVIRTSHWNLIEMEIGPIWPILKNQEKYQLKRINWTKYYSFKWNLTFLNQQWPISMSFGWFWWILDDLEWSW